MIREELVGLVEKQEPGNGVKESVCARVWDHFVSGFRFVRNGLYEARTGY